LQSIWQLSATVFPRAAMCGVSLRALSEEWTRGKHDAENGVESDGATWYRSATAARARYRATLRAEARAAAGSREATDKLAVLAASLSEEEPTTFAQDHDVRSRSLFLDTQDYSPETQDAIKVAQLALHDAFSLWVQEDTERRAVA
jgi:hypothetical protein